MDHESDPDLDKPLLIPKVCFGCSGSSSDPCAVFLPPGSASLQSRRRWQSTHKPEKECMGLSQATCKAILAEHRLSEIRRSTS